MLCIREAALSDVTALQELYLKHLTQHPPEGAQDINEWSLLLAKLINDSDYHLLVGTIDDDVVSSVTLVVIRNLTHNLRPYSLIENVVTHCDYRKMGYASAMIEEAGKIAKDNDCYKMMLMTGSKEESTLRVYERCGFNMNDKTAFIKWL